MNFRETDEVRSPGVPLAPMLDVVFLLLCFFIATQVFSQWESELSITLPTVEEGEPPQRLHGELILNVRSNGEVVINRRTYEPDALRQLLRRLIVVSPGYPVLVRADARTPYQYVINVLDSCRQSEIWNISFATLDEKKK